MDIPTPHPMTQEEFFAWVPPDDLRYEFDGFRPVAMTGGTGNHGLISGNLMYQLKSRLRGTGCVPSGTDGPGVKTTGRKIRYPDAVVTCTKFGGRDRLIPSPVVIFEVLSESSFHMDCVVKLREYHAVPSIKRYFIVEQTEIGVTCYARQGEEAWTAIPLLGDDVLELPEIGIQIPIAEVYEGVTFEALVQGESTD
jgi:Uma2 family endonuclease